MTDRWTDRLSEYLDGELAAGEAARLEAHLVDCAACRETLTDLRRVMERAVSLPDVTPSSDLWPAIHARIEAERAGVVPIGAAGATPPRAILRFAFTVPQLAAASVGLLCVGALAARLAFVPAAPPPSAASAETAVVPAVGAMPVAAVSVAPGLDTRIAELEDALEQARGRLEPETIAVIEKNLAIVDAALRDAQAALTSDPGNDYLRTHVERTMRTKVDVLERATALARAEI